MWRVISLRDRLTILFAALLLAWLAIDIGRMVAQAGPRARSDAESVTALTTEFVTAALAHVQDSAEPMRDLLSLVASLQNIRHMRVGLAANGDPTVVTAFAAASSGKAPEWFRALARAPVNVVTIPVILRGHQVRSVLIVADPSDEIDEVWSAALTQAGAGGVLALALMAGSSLFIRWTLKPLGLAENVLTRLQSGDYSARAEPLGSPEFIAICGKINALATALSELRAANADLFARLLDAQDAERKAIAHELHDEIGPHLFALRARAAMLASRLKNEGGEAATAANAIRDQVEALQGQNKRILARLRPAALEELGLREALRALVERWRAEEPEVNLEYEADERIADLGERASLMAYRFVQEALTNAYRHARARHIEVSLSYSDGGANDSHGDPALAGLHIRVLDDGQGLSADAAPGMGHLGMRERVRALGGTVTIGPAPNGGAIVEARFDGEG